MPGARAPDEDGISHPDRIGRYVLLLPIASGGMGTVYLARTRGIGGFERDVALKLSHVHLKSAEFTIALLDEAVLAGGIRHPNVVSVLDVGEDPYGLYLVMEYVEGDSLAGLTRRARRADTQIPAPIALRIMDDALAGLHAAHELVDVEGHNVGLVHRDFSPQNILVGVDGLAKLTDFGVAKALNRLSQTTSGAIKGKVAYMSPEQAQGHALDRRVDVWAAGVVAWELLTGTRLHTGVPDAVALLKIVSERPPPARHVNPAIPEELDKVVARALEPEVGARLQTADLFARELSRAARATVGLAERREVAEFVSGLVGPVLASRREKVRKVVELKEQMGLLIRLPERRANDRASFGDSSPSATGEPSSGPTASVPDQPSVIEAPSVATEALVPDSSAEVGNTDTLALSSTGRARPAEVAAHEPRKMALVALAVGVSFSALLAMALVRTDDERLVLTRMKWQPLPSVQPAAAPAPATESKQSSTLSVRADAPVKELMVDGVVHAVEPPRRTFALTVEREPDAPSNIEAVSVEGGRVTLKLGRGESLARLRFPVIPKGPAAAPGPPAGPRKILPSPYGQ